MSGTTNPINASYFGLPSLPTTPAPAVAPGTSPLAGAQDQTAYNTLMSLVQQQISAASPLDSGVATGPGLAGKAGERGTGNIAQDARNAYNSGLFGFGLNALANPASLVTTVPGTMLGAAIRGITNQPEPASLRAGLGIRGALNAISGIFGDRAAQHAAAAKAGDTHSRGGQAAQGGGKDKPDAAPADYAGWGSDYGGGKAGGGGGKGDMGGYGGGDFGDEGSATGGEDGGQKAGGGLVKPTDGALIALAGGGKIATGPGGGLDDLIPTTIEGRRAAALSDGEFVIPADVVSMFGDGSTNAGSRRLYDLIRSVREQKTGSGQQAGPLPVGDILKRALA